MRLKLTYQFTAVVGVVLLFVMSTFAFFDFYFLKRFFYQISRENADRQCEAFIRGARHLMLENNAPLLKTWVEGIAGQAGVRSVRVVDQAGRVAYSSDELEVGRVLDKQGDPACSGCHLPRELRVEAPIIERSRLFRDAQGEEMMGVVRGVYNAPECAQGSCHPGDIKVLGVFDLQVSLKESNDLLAAYRNHFLLQSVFVVLAIILALGLLTQRLINQPVSTLLESTRSLARGEWKEVRVPPGDEFGELGESFNSMMLQLRQAMSERDQWAQTLEARVQERARELQQMQKVLVRSEKLASVGELAAGIAHELNNPLTGILMLSSLAVKDPRLDPVLARDFQTIISEVSRCAKIVGGLLDFSRETLPQKVMASLEETLERALGLIRHHTFFHDVRVECRYAGNLPPVLMDSGQMEQVFLNILVNAAQSMPEGGTLTITTGTAVGGEAVFVRIADTGAGIPPEILPRIFDPFFSTKGATGTGLGLAVSYGIVENHGGRIEVTSKMGEGTAFTILLPVRGEGEP